MPFGDASLGSRMRGFDRPFLLSLRAGASAGKVVLGEILRDEGSLGPSAGQRIAVGQQRNIRPLNIYSDPDEVVRRVPLTFPGVGAQVPSMALELASRAQKAEPVFADDGSVTLAGDPIPSAVQNTLTLNSTAALRISRPSRWPTCAAASSAMTRNSFAAISPTGW